MKHGLVIITENPIVPVAGKFDKPAGPLFAIEIALETVSG